MTRAIMECDLFFFESNELRREIIKCKDTGVEPEKLNVLVLELIDQGVDVLNVLTSAWWAFGGQNTRKTPQNTQRYRVIPKIKKAQDVLLK